MTAIRVDCLRCGQRHSLLRADHGRLDHGECPRCGYVGWTPVRARPVRRPSLLLRFVS